MKTLARRNRVRVFTPPGRSSDDDDVARAAPAALFPFSAERESSCRAARGAPFDSSVRQRGGRLCPAALQCLAIRFIRIWPGCSCCPWFFWAAPLGATGGRRDDRRNA